jgi:hypothetical protein
VPFDPNAPGSTSQGDNQYTVGGAVVLLPSAARTASGNSGTTVLDCAGSSAVGLELFVSSVSGTTPSMTVAVDWSNDGVNWGPAYPADDWAALTTAARRFKNVAVKGRYLRLAWTIAGTTPSFTFTVNALELP